MLTAATPVNYRAVVSQTPHPPAGDDAPGPGDPAANPWSAPPPDPATLYNPTTATVVPAGAPAGDQSGIPSWLIGLMVVLMVAGAGLVAVALKDRPSEAQVAAISYPSRWDRRIAPYVRIVEKERGLRFDHPVAVRFLGDRAFDRTLVTDDAGLDPDERAALDREAAAMRSLGLIDGDVDLLQAYNDASTGSVLAYYSFADQRITVRGDRFTPAVAFTVVHELTHALQDQRFAIGERLKQLREIAATGQASGRLDVLRGLIEGDAERVAELYRTTLSSAQRRDLARYQDRESAGARSKLGKVPPVIVTLSASPYALGISLARTFAAQGGNRAVDSALQNAPAHDLALLDPMLEAAGDTTAAEIPLPGLRSSETTVDSGEFGALSWYYVLAQRIPIRTALAAADGWGGDAYVQVDRDGVACMRASVTGRTEADTGRLRRALQQWVDAGPAGSASTGYSGSQIGFEACDPGTAAKAGRDHSADALKLAAVRASIGISLLEADLPPLAARCVSDKLLGAYSVAQLSRPTFGAGDTTVRARLQRFAAACS